MLTGIQLAVQNVHKVEARLVRVPSMTGGHFFTLDISISSRGNGPDTRVTIFLDSPEMDSPAARDFDAFGNATPLTLAATRGPVRS
jgi:hypothetical protein